jgi:hypothetical protein
MGLRIDHDERLIFVENEFYISDTSKMPEESSPSRCGDAIEVFVNIYLCDAPR